MLKYPRLVSPWTQVQKGVLSGGAKHSAVRWETVNEWNSPGVDATSNEAILDWLLRVAVNLTKKDLGRSRVTGGFKFRRKPISPTSIFPFF